MQLKLLDKKFFLISFFAFLYAFLSLKLLPVYSRDYYNIVNSIDFTLNNLELNFFWVLYHIKGNTILLMPFDIIGVLDAEKCAYLLYFIAIFMRFYVAFKFLNFKTALSFMFAFFWMLDWNQARFSLAFSLFILLSQKKQIIQPLIHYGLILRVIYERFKLIKRFYYLLPILAILLVSFIELFFSRYFLLSDDSFPLYSVVYILFFIFISYLNKKFYNLKDELIFGLSTLLFFYIMINTGLSWTYFGRFSEIILMISIANYIKQFENKNFNSNFLFRSALYLIGFYQLLTINGNVWRFFS